MKHELVFLDSLYRVTDGHVLVFDSQEFQKSFTGAFNENTLHNDSTEELQKSFQAFTSLLDPYRIEAQKIRDDARLKRASLVAEESKKWIDTTPALAPIPDIYSQILISLKYQMMYVYEDGDLIFSTPITSGRESHKTILGTFAIYTKQRNKLMKSPFPDIVYSLWVDYWMGFSGAYGIHDACNSKNCWRTHFGGPDYVSGGSHGCINTPYAAVKWLYSWAHVGTTVHIE